MNLHISLSGLRATSPRGAAVLFLLSSFLLFSTPLSTNATQGVAAGAAFAQWLASLWPEAHAMGISRTTFETATPGLGPGFSLPDLPHPRPRHAGPSRGTAAKPARIRSNACGLSARSNDFATRRKWGKAA